MIGHRPNLVLKLFGKYNNICSALFKILDFKQNCTLISIKNDFGKILVSLVVHHTNTILILIIPYSLFRINS